MNTGNITMDFRSFLINIFNQLSDDNRKALHFLVVDGVTRRVRDDCTPAGSLQLLDSLFDHNVISEENFDYLINVFEKIKCYDISNQLKS